MSTENQSQLPDAQAAYDTIYEGVHSRAFLHKMAQLGYPSATEEEAKAYLDLGTKVAAMHTNGTITGTKEAAGKASTLVNEATSALDKLAGINSAAVQDKQEVKQAAFELANDPKIYAAALVLKHAQATAAQEPAAQPA